MARMIILEGSEKTEAESVGNAPPTTRARLTEARGKHNWGCVLEQHTMGFVRLLTTAHSGNRFCQLR